jgi:hypothetical protein
MMRTQPLRSSWGIFSLHGVLIGFAVSGVEEKMTIMNAAGPPIGRSM